MREVCTGALLLVLTATISEAADQAWGLVAAIEGRARLIRSGESTRVEMKKRDKVFSGDRIEAEKASKIHVLLFAKSALRVEDVTSLEIHDKGVDVWEGRVRYNVPLGSLEEGEKHEVRTRNATVRISDAVVSVETASSPGLDDVTVSVITKVCVLRGSGHVALPSGASVALGARECGTVVGSQPDIVRTDLGPPSPATPPAATRARPRLHP